MTSHLSGTCNNHRPADVVHAPVQPTGQAAATEMVHGVPGQDKEEDHTGTRHHHSRPQAQDVLVPRVEGLQNCLQEVGWVLPV